MDGPVIELSDVTKYYGKKRGIENLSLEVFGGEAYGFLGPNGAGKTTTIRILMGLIKPKSGKAFIFANDVRRKGVLQRSHIGYLPGELSLYDNLTGEQHLKYFANLRGGIDWEYARSLSERFRMELSERAKNLSHGNRQKLGILLAFFSKPKLLILDEPTAGLDPIMQLEFYKLLSEVKAGGSTIFLSSHILSEVQRVCDRVGVIRDGKLVAQEDIKQIRKRAVRRLELEFTAAIPKNLFEGIPNILEVKIKNSSAMLLVQGNLNAVIKRAAQFGIRDLLSREPDLEDFFMSYYQ